MSSRCRDDARARIQTPRQNIVSFAAPLSCRNGEADGARKLRACGLALLTRTKHKSSYIQSRP